MRVETSISDGQLVVDVYTPARLLATRPNVVLLHGWLGSALDMGPIATLLADMHSARIYAPYLPFHGLSAGIQASSPNGAARLVCDGVRAAMRRYASGDNASAQEPAASVHRGVVLVGYSMGGRIAFELASDSRLRAVLGSVHALVLISAAPPPMPGAERGSANTRVDARMRHAQIAGRVEAFAECKSSAALYTWLRNDWYALSMWGGLSNHAGFERLLESRIDNLIGNHVIAAAGGLHGAGLRAVAAAAVRLGPSEMTSYPVKQLRQELDGVPFMYICGAQDQKYALTVCAQWRAIFHKRFTTMTIPENGHNVVFESPNLVGKTILRFVSPFSPWAVYPAVVPFKPLRVHIKRYTLAMKIPMQVGSRIVSDRAGFWVALESNTARGVGDVAPLPGLHAESLDETIDALREWAALHAQDSNSAQKLGFVHKSCHVGGPGALLRTVEDATRSLPPVLQNAIGAALLMGIAQENAIDPTDMLLSSLAMFCHRSSKVVLNSTVPRHVEPPTNNLPSSSTTVQTRVAAVLQSLAGGRTIKLKVGQHDVAVDAAVVTSLAPSLRACKSQLRLDANCSWESTQYAQFCQLTASAADVIEYVEEPLSLRGVAVLLSRCAALHAEHRSKALHGIALDESLMCEGETGSLRAVTAQGVVAVVVKPALLGSVARITRLVQAAGHCKVVLSSVFDSSVGLAWVAVLANVLGVPQDVAHGLGTFDAIQKDCGTKGFEECCVVDGGKALDVHGCWRLLEKSAHDVVDDPDEIFVQTW